MKYFSVCILICLVSLAITEQFIATSCTQLNFLPMPNKIKCNLNNRQPRLIVNPCGILYKIKSSISEQYKHFVQLIEHQQYKSFNCHVTHIVFGNHIDLQTTKFQYTVEIQVADPGLKNFQTTLEESYYAKIEQNKTQLTSEKYVGFVRALQTFIQSITCDRRKIENCFMKYLPIIIQDKPTFAYRSIMIDSSRHFLPVRLIYQTIDALMYNKMSVLHWHIVDQDSFPLQLKSHPQIAQYGAFSREEIYTRRQIEEIVKYARVRGVRIIPEIDTPGHAASWGRAPQNKDIACAFGDQGYMGPLDVTLSATYKMVKEVFAQVFQMFPDPYVHLGGDEVSLVCLKNKTQFVKAQNIQQQQIQLRYRKIQRRMLKEINPNKKFVYWMNGIIDLEEGDIVHWWGGGLPNTNLSVIISQYGPFYIDMGVGNYFGSPYGVYQTWLDIYMLDISRMIQNYSNRQKVLGAELTLWSESSNQYTHHLKIWIRSSAIAERSWSIVVQSAKPHFLRRLMGQEMLMNRRGIPTAPGTCQQCQLSPEFC